MPLPALPDTPGIEHYLQRDADAIVLGVPVRDFRMQALLVLLLLPGVWLGLGLLVALSLPPDIGAPLAGTLVCLGTGASTLAGLVMLLRAPGQAARTHTRLEADGSLVLPDGRRLPFRTVDGIRVGQPNKLMKWIGLLGSTDDGEVVILGRLPPSRGKLVAALAEYVGEALQVPVDTRTAATGLGMSPEVASAWCYLPIQGLWLIFSLFALVLGRDPQLRFAARQSLAWYLLSGFGLVVVIVPFATVAALLPDDGLRQVAAVLVILLILPLALGRIVVGSVAGWRAWKGRPWVIPGLGWLSRRWLPPVTTTEPGSIDR